MKKGYIECPFCANEIKKWAKKCQYCKEFLFDESIKSDNKSLKTNKRNWNSRKLIITEKQLESCINTGNRWISRWCRIIAARFPIWIIFKLDSLLNWEKVGAWLNMFWLLWMLLIISLVYYLIRLIKNYKILFDSNIHWLVHKSYFNLVFCWICPVLNLFKPNLTLNDLLLNITHKFWEEWDKNLVKKRLICWDITLISFALIYIPRVPFSDFALIIYVIFNIIQICLLAKIVRKIIHAEELLLENFNSK